MIREEFAVIGKKVPKYDGLDKVTGQAQYATDIVLPGMLHGAILRSPLPHARILNVDTRRAARLPGVKAIITGKDIPQIGFGAERDFSPEWGDQRVLQLNKVRYIGDEIAAVAAVDEDTAQEALNLIKVDFEELPAVFDPEEAMLEGAPEIHEGVKNNISICFPLVFGDPEQWQKADYIIEDRFSTQMVNQCTMGPRCAIAKFDNAGNLTIWRDTQFPFGHRAELAHVLQMDPKKVNVMRTAVGGGFGSKIDMQPFDAISAFLARETDRPVRVAYSREDEFCCGHPRHPFIYYLKTGVKKDGTLVGREARVIVDNGAYNALGPLVPLVAMHSFVGLYKVPYVKYDAYTVYTNKTFGSAFRGFGNPQGTFAVEQHMDMIAEKIGMDPMELRLKNVNQPNSDTINGFKITSCGLEECIRSAADKAGWSEIRGKQSAKKRGIGMGSLIHVAGGARVFGLPGVGLADGTGTVIKIDNFGKVVVSSGATDIGEGSDTIVAQIVAETLGVPYEDVVLHKPDTDSTPFDLGCHASRTTFCAGNSARLAALEARKQILELAAKLMQTQADDLELTKGKVVVRNKPEQAIDLVEVLQKSQYNLSNDGQAVIGSAYYEPPNGITDPQTVMGNMSSTYAFGTHMVEVEVDIETGQVKILNFVAAHDTGRTINPLGARGQTFGGVAQGIGYALTEEVVFKNGKVANSQFLDYKILTALDMPPVQTIDIETVDPEGPYGAKGVGEPGLVPTAAAIANAVYDAIGVRITDLPITPEKILKALDARK